MNDGAAYCIYSLLGSLAGSSYSCCSIVAVPFWMTTGTGLAFGLYILYIELLASSSRGQDEWPLTRTAGRYFVKFAADDDDSRAWVAWWTSTSIHPRG